MKIPTIRLHYDRKKRSAPDRMGYIDIEVYFERKRKYFSTGVGVLPSEWSADGVKGRPDAFALNLAIQKKKQEVQDAITALVASEGFSFQALECRLKGKDPRGSFVEYVEQWRRERRDIRESTRVNHRRLVNALRDFKRIEKFSDLTLPNVKAFDNWLRGRYDNENTIYCYHKFLKQYINSAIVDGYVEQNPYFAFKVKRCTARPRKYLEEEEIMRLMRLDVEDGSVMRARDLFLFQCFTGLSYSDMAETDFTKLTQRGGKYILHRARKKTGVEYHVVLLSPAVAILERYNFKLPIITNQKYNMALKAVAAYTGVKFKLTSHCGRHTYATWALNQGVSVESLRLMLGHSTTKTTELYARMLDATVEDAFEDLEESISEKMHKIG